MPGRRASVTGSAGGIGSAIQRALERDGVAPGPVETALLRAQLDDPTYGSAVRASPVALGRWGDADEIAAAVRFLLSEDAAWIHGVVLPVDGGTDAFVHPDRP